MKDYDVGWGSFYMYVDFSSTSKVTRLTMSAPWDFDLAEGNKQSGGGWGGWGGWGREIDKDYTNYQQNAQQARAWLERRAPFVYAKLTPYEMTDEEIFGIKLSEDPDRTDPYIIDAVRHPSLADKPARFDVYDLNGVRLKAGETYDTYRQGLKPGLYIVNGRKVLITQP